MKPLKSHKPFLIKDSKNQINYFTLLYGLLSNEIQPVRIALKNKAQINKLFIDENPDYDSYRHFSEEDSEAEYVLIPALDFAQRKCSAEIFKEIMKTCTLDDKSQANIVFKAIAQIRADEDISKNKDLQETLKIYLNKKNINKHYKIKSLSDPMNGYSWREKELEATFLHVAAKTLNKELIKALVNLGADVNLKTKGESEGRTASHIIIDKTPSKGNQDYGVNCLLALFNLGVNCELKNRDGENIWEAAVAKFKIPQLKIIFANKQPLNLKTIESIRKKSPHLYGFWQKKSPGFIKYPLINDIFKYEKLNISLGDGFSQVNNIEQFFRNKSLKKALEQRYKTSSSRLCSVITKNLFEKSEEKVLVKPKYLQKVDVAFYLFMDKPNPNMSDFLEVLEKNSKTFASLVEDISYSYRNDSQSKLKDTAKKIDKTLSRIYAPSQIKQVITNDEVELEDSIDDILEMYNSFPKELDTILKRTKFSQINNLQYLHDFLSGETNTLEQENFKLEQDKFKPELKKLSEVKMSLGYGIKLAEENHDLIRWGATMGHCVGGGSYAKEAKQGETIIMAITKDNEPSYCVEISPKGVIRQVQGKSRSTPNPSVMEEFVKGLKSIGVLNKSQKATKWQD